MYNISDIKVRIEMINTMESGTYHFKTVDSMPAMVVVDKGKGMDVKYLNEKLWWECIEYNKEGIYQCDWVEKADKPHAFQRKDDLN
jgi:hypothetical protein